MAARAHSRDEVRQRQRHAVDLRWVRLGHDANVVAHDAIIVAADTARTSVKNRLPDYGVTMSFVTRAAVGQTGKDYFTEKDPDFVRKSGPAWAIPMTARRLCS